MKSTRNPLVPCHLDRHAHKQNVRDFFGTLATALRLGHKATIELSGQTIYLHVDREVTPAWVCKNCLNGDANTSPAVRENDFNQEDCSWCDSPRFNNEAAEADIARALADEVESG